MGQLTNYRIAFAIDMFLLWVRSGGKYAFLALAVVLITRMGQVDLPFFEWVGPVAIVVALIAAVWGALGCLRAYNVWNRGLEGEARIDRIEKSTGKSHNSTRQFKTRIKFSYQVDGRNLEGTTTWGSPGRTGVLSVGQRIPVRYLPDDPRVVFWDEDLPISLPPVNFR